MDQIKQKTELHIASFFSEGNEESLRRKPMYNQSTAGKSYRFLKEFNEIKDWEHQFQTRKLSMFAAQAN